MTAQGGRGSSKFHHEAKTGFHRKGEEAKTEDRRRETEGGGRSSEREAGKAEALETAIR